MYPTASSVSAPGSASNWAFLETLQRDPSQMPFDTTDNLQISCEIGNNFSNDYICFDAKFVQLSFALCTTDAILQGFLSSTNIFRSHWWCFRVGSGQLYIAGNVIPLLHCTVYALSHFSAFDATAKRSREPEHVFDNSPWCSPSLGSRDKPTVTGH